MILAITGGTGFVGGTLIALAREAGHDIRALARRPQPERTGVTWVAGALNMPDALHRLVAGADAVIHVAGVVNAPDRAGFAIGNIEGTKAMIDAAARVGVQRFVHVSSIAAREPDLSVYGWSKSEAERVVTASTLAWTIVRPPAIYGAGDMEMRDLFRMARTGIGLLPSRGRLSIIAVADIAALLLALVGADAEHATLEADDGRSGGWTHSDMMRAIGTAVGRRTVVPIVLPRVVLTAAAWTDRVFRGVRAKLTPDRVGYLAHPDWTIDPAKRPPPSLWTPRIDTPAGLAATAAWYRAHGFL